jgi:hypothetical protein
VAKKKRFSSGHTGSTVGGHTRYVKADRIGNVTIYKRGKTYSLYYRENGRAIRSNIDGNLAVARATASRANGQLEESQRSLFSFRKVTPKRLVEDYLVYVRDGQKLAGWTADLPAGPITPRLRRQALAC